MSLVNCAFRKKILVSAVGLACGSIAMNSMAVSISADVAYSVGGGPIVTDSDSSTVDPSNVDILAGANVGGNGVFYHTFGNTAGTFGARVSGDGEFDITSSFTFFNSYSNNSNASQDFSFDFSVIPGNIGTSIFGSIGAGESLFSSYNLDVMVDYDQDGNFDSNLFNSGASISTSAAGSTLTTSGTALNGASYIESTSSANYSWSQTIDSLFVGTIAPSDSFDIQYILTTSANGNVSSVTNDCNQEVDFDGDQEVLFVARTFGCPGGSAVSRIGDPFTGPSFASVNSVATPIASVPEPYTLTLFALSLVGLCAVRRRKADFNS